MSAELDEAWNEGFTEGYVEGWREARELLQQAVELIDGARCSFADPSLRMGWGRRRRALLNAIQPDLFGGAA